MQPQATAKNGLTFNGKNSTVYVSGGSHNHGGYTSNTSISNQGASIAVDISAPVRIGACPVYGQSGVFGDHRHSIPYSGELTMSGSYTPSGNIYGDTETRPTNYTIRVWKRIA